MVACSKTKIKWLESSESIGEFKIEHWRRLSKAKPEADTAVSESENTWV